MDKQQKQAQAKEDIAKAKGEFFAECAKFKDRYNKMEFAERQAFWGGVALLIFLIYCLVS